MKIPSPITSERYDVFDVQQVTRATPLESLVAVDLVSIAPHETSESHRHNQADTVLLILNGSGQVCVGDSLFDVVKGDRIRIPPGAFHSVRTQHGPMEFLSVQSPPILSKEKNELDLELEHDGVQ